ncbi:MAG: CRISPR-associated endonuclease Cas2 [Bacteroidetes bacterium]|nr:MAG: CRISPR-associated endonuclease Cas2 [Bacteroidota bacterium]
MIVWVLYDISNDKARAKVAKHCRQAGLYRVQYSVFLGSLNANELDELGLAIEALIAPDTDKAYLFTMNQKDLRNCVLLGQAFDKKLVSDQVKALFL